MTATRSPRLLILGSHIFAEEVADLAQQAGDHVVGFVENWDRARCDRELLGLPIHWIDDVAPLVSEHVAVCAIGTPKRRGFVEQAEQLGLGFTTLVHPGATISPRANVGEGTIASARVVVATATEVGRHVILNRGVMVGHHTTIGSFVTVSPGANVAGCVTVGDGAYVGMGATILDRITIGAGAVIGAGSVVTKDVPERAKVLGVPARVVSEEVDPP